MDYSGHVEVEQESVVVVYDPKTGDIVHRHHAMTAKGGTHPDQKTLEHDAMEQLSVAQPHADIKNFAILHVDPAVLKSAILHKVDIAKKALVAIEPLKPKKRA